MRCLEKNRARRYPSVSAVAADLRRHLAHEPVTARPPSTTYRLQKLIARNRVTFAAGALVLLSLVAGLFIATNALVRETKARRDARQAEQMGGEARQNAERLLAFILSELGEELDVLGQLPALRSLNRQVLAYYEQLNPTLHTRETRAGLALARTGTASVGWFNTDRLPDLRLGEPASRRRFADALQVMEELETSGPLTPFIRVAYAGVLWGLVGQCYREGRGGDGVPLLDKAETLIQATRDDPQWGRWAEGFLVRIPLGRGFLIHHYHNGPDLERRQRAIAEYRQALARAEERDRRGLNPRRPGLLAAEIQWRLSQALTGVGRRTEALALLEQAQAQLRDLLAREPFLVAATTSLANTYYQQSHHFRAEWRFDAGRRAIDEAIRLFEQVVKSDPGGWGKNAWMLAALVNQTGGKISFDWYDGDFPAVEASLRRALAWLDQPQAPPDSRFQLLGVRYHLARLLAATHRDTEADDQLAAARHVTARIAEERPWLTRRRLDELLARAGFDDTQQCEVEAARLNWAGARTLAARILETGRAAAGSPAWSEPVAATREQARWHLVRAAFELGDYAAARRELAALDAPAETPPASDRMDARFRRLQRRLTRIHVLARAGELPAARTELARLWADAANLFAAGHDALFVRIEHARALSLRAEVEPADTATRRQWLTQAAALLRPAAAAGRLTRYEREVLLQRIERQLAELETARPENRGQSPGRATQ